MSVELVQIIDSISHEKGIDRKILIGAIEAAVLAAARKRFPAELELSVIFNESTGETELYAVKDVVTKVANPELEISLKDAKKIDPDAKKDQKIKVLSHMESLGRIAALNAKQFILQRVREAESEILYNSFKDRINEVVSAVVLRQERRDIIVDLGKIEGILPRREQVPSEKFKRNDRIRAYVLDIKKGPKGVYALLSRTNPGLISRLFEVEVPEIYEGIIEIKGVAREPSGRSKIAVYSKEKDVDPVGACVGMRGVRVQSIVNELQGEKIDIVEWSEDPTIFVTHALSPAKISRVNLFPEKRSMEVIAPDDQLSLAIGKRGQNVRLASSLIKWRIDIKGEKELRQEIEDKESKTQRDKENFVALLQITEGIQDEDIKILLGKGLNNFQKVVAKGKEELINSGLSEDKAQAVFQLSEIRYKEDLEKDAEVAKDRRTPEKMEDKAAEAPYKETKLPPSEPEAVESDIEIVENIEEFTLEKLADVPELLLERLKAAGYQTIAELSAAEVSELLEDGLEQKEAEEIHLKAIEFIELHEKV
jgi:N utilization substance protein A